MILSFRTDMPGQTVQTQIRLLLGNLWYILYHESIFAEHALGQTCYAAVSEACSDTLAECRSSGTAVTCQCRSAYTNTNGVCTGESGEFCKYPVHHYKNIYSNDFEVWTEMACVPSRDSDVSIRHR